MIVAGFDVETTGLDVTKDHVIQVAIVLWCTETHHALFKWEALLDWPDLEIPEDARKVHGIDSMRLEEYGRDPKQVLAFASATLSNPNVAAIVAHNGNLYDRPIYVNNCRRVSETPADRLWIDTSCDVPYPEAITTRKLSHLAAEHHFLNPFPHDALSDVMTMLKIADKYDWQTILNYANSPSRILRAMVSFDTKELAKKLSYRWNGDSKIWTKRVKEFQVEGELQAAATAGFKATLLEEK